MPPCSKAGWSLGQAGLEDMLLDALREGPGIDGFRLSDFLDEFPYY